MHLVKISDQEVLQHKVLSAARIKELTTENIIRLANQINNNTSIQISPITLSRFFGLTESKFGPSAYTVYVLELYCQNMNDRPYFTGTGYDGFNL